MNRENVDLTALPVPIMGEKLKNSDLHMWRAPAPVFDALIRNKIL